MPLVVELSWFLKKKELRFCQWKEYQPHKANIGLK